MNGIKLFKYLIVNCLLLVSTVSAYGQKSDSKEINSYKEVVYKEINGTKLKLYLFQPEGFKKSKKYPTIIFFFGGGWTGRL